MDIGLRESLIIIGMIVIAGILFDGYRRMKINRRRARELSLGMGAGLQDDADDFNNELPNGGSRIVAQSEPDNIPLEETTKEVADPPEPEPPLINTTVVAMHNDKVTPLQRHKTTGEVTEKKRLATEDKVEVLTADKEDHYGITAVKPATPVSRKTTKRTIKVKEKEPVSTEAAQLNRAVAEEVIIINVVSKTSEGFDGKELLQALLANGLKFGEMQIFHRHEQPDGKGSVLFSAANGVEPGVFDLSTMEQLKTTVVSLFMSLPGPAEPMKAFEELAMAAYYLAKNLQGELKDEQHSVMTQQTLEHCRQRIMDYERRDLVRKQSIQ